MHGNTKIKLMKTHILYLITSFEDRAVYEIMRKNNAEPDGP